MSLTYVKKGGGGGLRVGTIGHNKHQTCGVLLREEDETGAHREECSCICFCSYFLVFGLPLCSFSLWLPTSEEPVRKGREELVVRQIVRSVAVEIQTLRICSCFALLTSNSSQKPALLFWPSSSSCSCGVWSSCLTLLSISAAFTLVE